MKIFQIVSGFCYWDATDKHPTLRSTKGKYTPDVKFVVAPDYVFESWGYDEQTGQFIKPEPPEGWAYDDTNGTFYKIQTMEGQTP